MNKIICLIFVCFAYGGVAQKLKVEIELTYNAPICDGNNKPGAAEVKNEKGLANCKFYVYSNNKCVDTVKTNENGIVVVKLVPGTYFLFESWKHFKRTPDNSPMSDFFSDCLAKEWAKPNYKLNIAEGDIKMEYFGVSASRCPNQYACLKVRHLPNQIKRQ